MRGREWKRVYGSLERVQWIASRPCDFCGDTPCSNAHVRNGGMGRKAGYQYIVSACARCHYELDRGIGKRGMEHKYMVSLIELAQAVDASWEKKP